jgi:hypothetical protein
MGIFAVGIRICPRLLKGKEKVSLLSWLGLGLMSSAVVANVVPKPVSTRLDWKKAKN